MVAVGFSGGIRGDVLERLADPLAHPRIGQPARPGAVLLASNTEARATGSRPFQAGARSAARRKLRGETTAAAAGCRPCPKGTGTRWRSHRTFRGVPVEQRAPHCGCSIRRKSLLCHHNSHSKGQGEGWGRSCFSFWNMDRSRWGTRPGSALVGGFFSGNPLKREHQIEPLRESRTPWGHGQRSRGDDWEYARATATDLNACRRSHTGANRSGKSGRRPRSRRGRDPFASSLVAAARLRGPPARQTSGPALFAQVDLAVAGNR